VLVVVQALVYVRLAITVNREIAAYEENTNPVSAAETGSGELHSSDETAGGELPS
jgi:hypothetical protein